MSLLDHIERAWRRWLSERTTAELEVLRVRGCMQRGLLETPGAAHVNGIASERARIVAALRDVALAVRKRAAPEPYAGEDEDVVSGVLATVADDIEAGRL